MSDYFGTLSQTQKSNIDYITRRMKEKGITNPISQAAILSVLSKESAFKPSAEISYRNTSNADIREIFGDRVAAYNEAALSKLKQDDVAFFEAVYGYRSSKGPELGNTQPGDGYRYRGRGLNGITGRALYKKRGDVAGIDLVNHPEQLEKLDIATDVMIDYFLSQFQNAPADKLKAYNTTGINGFSSIADAVGAMYHANAGWNKSIGKIQSDSTGGRKKAMDRSGGFYQMVSQFVSAPIEIVKKKPWLVIGAVGLLLGGLYLLSTEFKTNES